MDNFNFTPQKFNKVFFQLAMSKDKKKKRGGVGVGNKSTLKL